MHYWFNLGFKGEHVYTGWNKSVASVPLLVLLDLVEISKYFIGQD